VVHADGVEGHPDLLYIVCGRIVELNREAAELTLKGL